MALLCGLLSVVAVGADPAIAGEAGATVASAPGAPAAGGPAPGFRFTDVSADAGVTGVVYSSESAHSLGVNWVDIDNDGWVDLFAVGGGPQYPPRLFRNLGDGTFEAAHRLVPKLPATDMSGSIFADYDNDGDRDIYVYTDRSEWVITRENQPDGPPNLLLQNRLVEYGGVILPGEPLFREAAALAGVDDRASPPLGELSAYRTKSAAWLDYNRDGCIDLYIGHLVMNAAGRPANRDRLGAVVRVEVEGQTLMRQIVGGSGGHSQSSLAVHFGLGPTAMVDAVEVLWPSGLRTRWANQPANMLIEVVEGAACQNDARAGCTEEASGLWGSRRSSSAPSRSVTDGCASHTPSNRIGVHALAHSMGAAFHIPHGRANAFLLCPVFAFLYRTCTARLSSLAESLGIEGKDDRSKVANLLAALDELKAKVGIPLSIRDSGLEEKQWLDQIDQLAARDAEGRDSMHAWNGTRAELKYAH